MFSLIVTFIVLLLIAIRRIGPWVIPMWLTMLAGAVVVVVAQQISLSSAWQAIDWDILGYLLGAFIIAQALEDSGALTSMLQPLMRRRHSARAILALMIFFAALGSMIMMNDTMAIVMTPLLLTLARMYRHQAQPWLLALCFAITIGSVMSPIGNPQNLLIALQGGINNPFLEFFNYLTLPTCINLFLCWLWLQLCFPAHWSDVIGGKNFSETKNKTPKDIVQDNSPKENNTCPNNATLDRPLFRIIVISIVLLLFLLAWHIVDTWRHAGFVMPLALVSIIAALPIILFCVNPKNKRMDIFYKIDWRTLVFFVGLFVLMRAVWLGGELQLLLAKTAIDWHSPMVVMWLSAALSQLVSNVPLVAMILPVLHHVAASPHVMLALAAGSTLAGQFLLLGAASNVIVLQSAQGRGDKGFSLWRFFIVGAPLGIINLLVYACFLH